METEKGKMDGRRVAQAKWRKRDGKRGVGG